MQHIACVASVSVGLACVASVSGGISAARSRRFSLFGGAKIGASARPNFRTFKK